MVFAFISNLMNPNCVQTFQMKIYYSENNDANILKYRIKYLATMLMSST